VRDCSRSTIQLAGRLLRLLSLATLSCCGCATTQESCFAERVACQPELCSSVSVIFVEATPDLFYMGHLPQLSGRFHRCGVRSFYFDPRKHGDAACLARWIEQEKSRGQKVVVVGWSYGLVHALDALKLLESRHVRVDTLVSLDCFWLNYHRGDQLHPPNVNRVALIYRTGTRLPGGFASPVVYRIDTYRHLSLPSHGHTIDALFQETVRLSRSGSSIAAQTASRQAPTRE
jgi:pimeloyl-ACP methyl ester carboxylesterase